MHVNEVLCHGENGGATWETSHRGYVLRKVVGKEVTARGRLDFFWTLSGEQPENFLLFFQENFPHATDIFPTEGAAAPLHPLSYSYESNQSIR